MVNTWFNIRVTVIVYVFSMFRLVQLTNSSSNSENIVEDKQHAVCKIVSDKIQATANVSITREIKGVCTSKQLNEKFNQLEEKLLKELHLLQNLVLNACKPPLAMPEVSGHYFKNYEGERILNGMSNSNFDFNPLLKAPSMKKEILKFNNTIQSSAEGNVYIYYWRIFNIRKILAKHGVYVSSPYFNVLGHDIFMQFHPHFYGTHYDALILKTTASNFSKKYIITIVNSEEGGYGIQSDILDTMDQENVFKIPPTIINGATSFIENDSMLVKLNIYLD